MSLENEALRGRLAADVLSNEVYTSAYDLLEKEIIDQWREARNPQDREQLHMMLGLLSKVKRSLESVMKSGQIADAEIRRRSLSERIGRRLKVA